MTLAGVGWLRRHVARFLADESGQSATEYILIIGLISVPMWVVFKLVLQKFLSGFITNLINAFTKG
jgi:Flp pilus assembly pilin Flp